MADFRKIDSSGNLILGGILAEDLPTHNHASTDIADFESQVNADVKTLFYCKSNGSGDFITSTGTALTSLFNFGGQGHYYKVRVEAGVSLESTDNDANYDFRAGGVFACYLQRYSESDPWVVKRAFPITDFDTERLFIDFEFLTTSSSNFYSSLYLSTSGIDEGMTIIPTNNLSRFSYNLTITKCQKITWFKRFTLSDSGWVSSPTTVITGTLPTTGNLPFIGFYHVDFYAQVRESLTIYGDDVNVTGSQSLEIREEGGTYLQLDRSGIFTPGVPNEGEKWMNRALQGSCILEITNTSNKLEYKLTLPNGMQRKLEGGYVHIKYIGSAESISL